MYHAQNLHEYITILAIIYMSTIPLPMLSQGQREILLNGQKKNGQTANAQDVHNAKRIVKSKIFEACAHMHKLHEAHPDLALLIEEGMSWLTRGANGAIDNGPGHPPDWPDELEPEDEVTVDDVDGPVNLPV